MIEKTHDQPSEVAAEDGQVIVDGPDGVAVTFSPEAAAETGDRLLFHSARARGQQINEEERRRPKPASGRLRLR
jgi:hypothetical protein